jgi:hypothetical protein
MEDTMHWHSNRIPWTEISPDGSKYALLEGSREHGIFSYAFFIPADFWDAPHWHTQDARVFVVSGALQLGYGQTHDPSQLETYKAGSYLFVPKDAVHFDGASTDTLILGVAQGQWRTHYVDSSHKPSAGTVS